MLIRVTILIHFPFATRGAAADMPTDFDRCSASPQNIPGPTPSSRNLAIASERLTTYKRPIVWVTLCGLLFACLLMLVRWFPPQSNWWYPKCWLHELTGLNCPGCGGTRAITSLAHGDLLAAVYWNPLLVIGLPSFVIAILLRRFWLSDKNRWCPVLGWLIAFIFFGFFVARNVPSPSKSPFAPTAIRGSQ